LQIDLAHGPDGGKCKNIAASVEASVIARMLTNLGLQAAALPPCADATPRAESAGQRRTPLQSPARRCQLACQAPAASTFRLASFSSTPWCCGSRRS